MAFGQYVNLDFDQIKTSIRDYLRANTNFTDYDFEGSNLSIIIDALAYNTYTTAYNTNMAANECFLDSATLRENVVSLARNIGYVPRSRRSARARVSFVVSGLTDTSTLTLNSGIVCNGAGTNTNYIFCIPEDITVPVTNGVGEFNNIEIYEGNFVSQDFTTDTSLTSQRYILIILLLIHQQLRFQLNQLQLLHLLLLTNKLTTLLVSLQPPHRIFYKKLKMKGMN